MFSLLDEVPKLSMISEALCDLAPTCSLTMILDTGDGEWIKNSRLHSGGGWQQVCKQIKKIHFLLSPPLSPPQSLHLGSGNSVLRHAIPSHPHPLLRLCFLPGAPSVCSCPFAYPIPGHPGSLGSSQQVPQTLKSELEPLLHDVSL